MSTVALVAMHPVVGHCGSRLRDFFSRGAIEPAREPNLILDTSTWVMLDSLDTRVQQFADWVLLHSLTGTGSGRSESSQRR